MEAKVIQVVAVVVVVEAAVMVVEVEALVMPIPTKCQTTLQPTAVSCSWRLESLLYGRLIFSNNIVPDWKIPNDKAI